MVENDDELMDPKASPRRVGHKVGVRRLNGRPLWLLLVVVIGFLAVMAKTAIDRSDDQRLRARTNESQGGDSTMFAQSIAGTPRGYIAPDPPAPPIVPISKEELDIPPPPPPLTRSSAPPQVVQRDDEAAKIRGMKVAAMLSAVRAPTAGKGFGAEGPDSGLTRQGTGRPGLPALPQMPGAAPGLPPVPQAARAASSGAGPQPTQLAAAGDYSSDAVAGGFESRANFEQWDNATPGRDRWRLRSNQQPPRSDYELRAGSVIPAVMITGINSDLAGPIIAQVSQNVYDTATGHELLIPQGTKLLGRYSNDIAFGQSRVLVAWQRLTYPDGRTLDIGSMPGAAEDGTAGFADRVNNHYLRLFGNALFLSAITGGIAISQRSNSSNFQAPTAAEIMSQQLGVALGQTIVQMIRKNLNISPTIEIRPGFRFNVITTRDVTLNRSYQAFDYKAGVQ